MFTREENINDNINVELTPKSNIATGGQMMYLLRENFELHSPMASHIERLSSLVERLTGERLPVLDLNDFKEPATIHDAQNTINEILRAESTLIEDLLIKLEQAL